MRPHTPVIIDPKKTEREAVLAEAKHGKESELRV